MRTRRAFSRGRDVLRLRAFRSLLSLRKIRGYSKKECSQSNCSWFDSSVSLQACVNTKDQLGRQSIHLAAQSGCITSLEYLITHHDADVNVLTEKAKRAPLHLAAKVSCMCTMESVL